MAAKYDGTMDIIHSFVVTYEQERGEWNKLKERALGICNSGLKDIDVMSTVTGRVKTTGSLIKKLENRHAFKKYSDKSSIMNDQLDFVGLRIVLYFPQQKQDVIQMIKRDFHYEAMRLFDRDWKPEEPGVYQNLFGEYVADHVWVTLHEKDRSGVGVYSHYKFEIQIMSVLMDACAGVSHDLEYKALAGDPTTTELKLLDALKGHVEVGELILEQLYRVHKRRVKTEDQQISSSHELGEILIDSIPESQLLHHVIGDLNGVLTVLRAMDEDTPRCFRSFLRTHDIKSKLRDDLILFHRNFYPIPPTVSFYLIEKLLPDLSIRDQEFLGVAGFVNKVENRPWYDSPYWQPLLWLSREIIYPQQGSSLSLTTSEVQRYVYVWCTEHYNRFRILNRIKEDCMADCMVDCLRCTQDNPTPGLDFVAKLCVLGLAPTVPQYVKERDEDDPEDDRFRTLAVAMEKTYSADDESWKKAICDYATSIENRGLVDKFRFLQSTKVVLWLMSLKETALLEESLKNWPLSSHKTTELDICLNDLWKLAKRHSNEEMIHLLNGAAGRSS
ncbi:hypothetical protein F5Y02DRAFT_417917 [Annulohypoxylon stygium]|nr:hypothetical protein F5Y02DRAFT_417917 [Annulohypoxylon stygium]